MERAHVRIKQFPPLQRGFEHSRLEEQLVATAYERAVPVGRQALSTPACSEGGEVRQDRPPAIKGGLSA